jgi:hypothetical protein
MILLGLTHISVAEHITEEEHLHVEEEAAIAEAEAAKGKKNEPPQLQQRVSNCNVRRKLKSDKNSGRWKNVLPGTQQLLELQMERCQQLGDVPHPQILLHQHPPMHKVLHRPDWKVQLLLSTNQGQLEELQVALLPLCPFGLPHLL